MRDAGDGDLDVPEIFGCRGMVQLLLYLYTDKLHLPGFPSLTADGRTAGEAGAARARTAPEVCPASASCDSSSGSPSDDGMDAAFQGEGGSKIGDREDAPGPAPQSLTEVVDVLGVAAYYAVPRYVRLQAFGS